MRDTCGLLTALKKGGHSSFNDERDGCLWSSTESWADTTQVEGLEWGIQKKVYEVPAHEKRLKDNKSDASETTNSAHHRKDDVKKNNPTQSVWT